MKTETLLLCLLSPTSAFVVQPRSVRLLVARKSSLKPNDEKSSANASTEDELQISFTAATKACSILQEPAFKKTSSLPRIKSYDKDLLFDEQGGRFWETGTTDELVPFDTIFERALDTAEDAFLHATRVPLDKGWVEFPKDEDVGRKSVVVLGSGWAAHALMKVVDIYRIRLIVVSPVNHFVFTPMLASAAVGTIEYRSMTEAVRCSNPLIDNYVEGEAVDIDVQNKVLTIQPRNLLSDTLGGEPPLQTLEYDQLVVAVGCKVADSKVPGAAKYCYRLKTSEDSRRLRVAVGECLEYACRPGVVPKRGLSEVETESRKRDRIDRLTWVIVGGGPTGVELAGELSDFVCDITKSRSSAYYKLKDEIQIVMVHGGKQLVQAFDEDLREHALNSLQSAGVDVRLNHRVLEVGDGWIRILNKDTNEEETIRTVLTIWAAGVAPVPFIETLLSKLPPEARGPSGRVEIDKWLRCPTYDEASFGSILVLGDAAAFEHQSAYLPQTAQVAGQQGAYVGRLLDREYDMSLSPPKIPQENGHDEVTMAWLHSRGLEEAPGFKFLNLGLLAYLGQGKALSQVQMGDFPLFSYAGSISFVLWRSVYLVKQVATRNRVLVLFDWIKCKIFGRDITRL